MPATRTAHQTKIEYDTAEAAFSDLLVGEKDAAFFTPKFRKEATLCISHPAATAPLKALCKASPASTTTTAATPGRRRIEATAVSTVPTGNTGFAFMQSVPTSQASLTPLTRFYSK